MILNLVLDEYPIPNLTGFYSCFYCSSYDITKFC
jgi:hypothetical protein